MSDQRCPRCGAARRPGDQWCGLCYADFREPPPPVVGDGAPPPAPVADAATSAPSAPAAAAPSAATPPLIRPPDQPGAVPPAGPAPSAAIPAQPVAPAPGVAAPFVPSTNPLAPTQLPEGVAPSAPPDPAAAGGPTAPGGGDPAEGLKWPCTGCGAQVPMAEDYCPDCGTGFLSQPVGLTTPTKVPLIGDLSSMNSGQKLMFGIAIATGVVVGMLALLFIGGTVFK